MSSDRQRSDDESPSTSSGSSDADQRDLPVPEPEEPEDRKQPAASPQQKKNTKLSSKTTAKLSTSAKRYYITHLFIPVLRIPRGFIGSHPNRNERETALRSNTIIIHTLINDFLSEV